jgi:hypothetical protein
MSYPNQQYPQQPGYPPAPPQYPQQQPYVPQPAPQYPVPPMPQPYPYPQAPAQQPPRMPQAPVNATLDDFMDQASQSGRGKYVNGFFRNPGQQLTMQVAREVTKNDVGPQTWQGQPKEPRWDGSLALKLNVPVLIAPSQDFPDGTGTLELKPADWADLQDAMAQAGVPRGTWPQEGAWITAWFAGWGQARQGRQARKITGFAYQVPGTPRPGTTPYAQPQPAPQQPPFQPPYAQQPPVPAQPPVPQWQPPQPPAYPIGQPPPVHQPGQPPQGAPPWATAPQGQALSQAAGPDMAQLQADQQARLAQAGAPGTAQFTPEGQAQQGPADGQPAPYPVPPPAPPMAPPPAMAAPPAMPSQMASLPPDQLAQMAALTGMDVSQLQGQPPQPQQQ